MDLVSILHTIVGLIGAVDAFTTSSKDLAESLEFLKTKLSSTHELLNNLEMLIEEESNYTSHSTPSPSHFTPDCSQETSTLRLIENGGRLKELQATLDAVASWLETLESKSKSKSRMKRILSTRSLSSQGHQRRIERFLDELESCKLTAHFVLTIALKYESITGQ